MILWRNINFSPFYHFDSDPRFPPFLLYVRWKSGVTFVRRCFRDEVETDGSIDLNALHLLNVCIEVIILMTKTKDFFKNKLKARKVISTFMCYIDNLFLQIP